MTRYTILRNDRQGAEGAGVWAIVAGIEASTADGAIRKHVQAGKPVGGTFVAIPARSFRPLVVAVETVTKVKTEAA